MLHLKRFLLCLAALVFSTHLHTAVGGVYTFTNIADSQMEPSHSFAGLAVNNNGVAVFQDSPLNGTTTLRVGSGGAVATVAVAGPGASYVAFDGNFSINDSGVVAYGAEPHVGADGIYTVTPGGVVNTIADTSSGQFLGFHAPAINKLGTVAFIAETNSGAQGVFTGNGGSPSQVMIEGTTYRALDSTVPSINDSGTVAIAARSSVNLPSVYTFSAGGAVTTVAGGANAASFTTTHINASGKVSFFGRDGLLDAVFKGDGGPLTEVANTGSSSPFVALQSSTSNADFFNSAIQDDGTVVFGAQLKSGGAGIFTGSDPAADKVIALGDPLFGSTLTRFEYDSEGSGNGYIGFSYTLANGVSGVAIAKAVPEPGCGVVGLCLVFCACRRRTSASS